MLTIIGMLALSVFALAATGPVSTGATCSTAKLSVTSNIWVVQGFDATATAYDATFCGVTGLALAGTEVPGNKGSVGSGPTGQLENILSSYGKSGTVYANGANLTDFNGLANYDLVLAGLLVKSNYNTVYVTIQVTGSNAALGSLSKLNVDISTIDDHTYWTSPAHIGTLGSGTVGSQSGTLTLPSLNIGTSGSSPYEGFLYIYTVYDGTHYFGNSGSNQIAPWTQAGKYPVTFNFTISPDYTF